MTFANSMVTLIVVVLCALYKPICNCTTVCFEVGTTVSFKYVIIIMYFHSCRTIAILYKTSIYSLIEEEECGIDDQCDIDIACRRP